MITNVKFTGSVAANGSGSWPSSGWPASQHVVWYVMSTSPQAGETPQLDWDVAVERASATQCTYHLTVRNLTNAQVGFEARFAILNA